MKPLKNVKKTNFAAVITLFIAVFLAFITLQSRFLLFSQPAVQTEALPCRIKLILYEGGTDIYLSNVEVVIPETGERFLISSGDYIFVEKDLTELTLLLFKEGYCDTAVFHLPLAKGKLKTVRYAMFINDGSLPFTVYCEAPTAEQVKNLLAAWKK